MVIDVRTSVGLDVHARSVVACGLDGRTGRLFVQRLVPDHLHRRSERCRSARANENMALTAGQKSSYGQPMVLMTARSRCLVVGSLLVTCVLMLSACGSTGVTASPPISSDAKIEARAIVADLEKPLKFVAPGPPINAGAARGKSIHFISAALDFEFTQAVLAGMRGAADELGIEIRALDAKGDPGTASRQIDQAISQGANAIAIMNFPAEILQEPIRAAKAAGIPVVVMFSGDAGLPTPAQAEMGVFANATYCYSCAGKQLAALAVANTDGPVHAAVVTVPDVASATLESDAFNQELTRLCGECSATTSQAPLSQWATDLPAIAASATQRSSVNLVVPVWDAMVPIMKPSLLASANGQISIVSYNATFPAMQDLQAGELITGLVGSPEEWAGWGAMDQLLRGIVGAEPAKSIDPGNRAFTRDSLASMTVAKGANSSWYGDADFKAGFSKLWGLA